MCKPIPLSSNCQTLFYFIIGQWLITLLCRIVFIQSHQKRFEHELCWDSFSTNELNRLHFPAFLAVHPTYSHWFVANGDIMDDIRTKPIKEANSHLDSSASGRRCSAPVNPLNFLPAGPKRNPFKLSKYQLKSIKASVCASRKVFCLQQNCSKKIPKKTVPGYLSKLIISLQWTHYAPLLVN